jgi:hypothetical protein
MCVLESSFGSLVDRGVANKPCRSARNLYGAQIETAACSHSSDAVRPRCDVCPCQTMTTKG